jgi:hypothetical protein
MLPSIINLSQIEDEGREVLDHVGEIEKTKLLSSPQATDINGLRIQSFNSSLLDDNIEYS